MKMLHALLPVRSKNSHNSLSSRITATSQPSREIAFTRLFILWYLILNDAVSSLDYTGWSEYLSMSLHESFWGKMLKQHMPSYQPSYRYLRSDVPRYCKVFKITPTSGKQQSCTLRTPFGQLGWPARSPDLSHPMTTYSGSTCKTQSTDKRGKQENKSCSEPWSPLNEKGQMIQLSGR